MRLAPLTSKDSTLVFRALLQAFAFPGRVAQLPPHLVARMPALSLPLLALTDIETSFCAPDEPELEGEIATITSARISNSRDAQFVMHRDVPSREFVIGLGRGTSFRPELGARMVLAWNAPFDANIEVGLSGPGVVPGSSLRVGHDLVEFLAVRAEVNAQPPAGIDCWLVSTNGEVVGLPRTTQIQMQPTSATAGRN